MPALAAAGIGAAGSLLGGITGGKGAAKAAHIQAQSAQAALNQQQAQFNTTQANEQPYMAAGTTGLNAYLNLLGLGSGGATGQQSAISALQASPLFTSTYKQGEDALLQNEAATGGVRGGNSALDQSSYGANLLNQLIAGQLGSYSGLANTGQAAASGLANAGQANSSAISSLLTQQGNANAAGVLGGANSLTNAFNNIGSIAGKYLTGAGSSGSGSPTYGGQDWNSWSEYGW